METNATSQSPEQKPRREKRPLNGVDVPTLFATINAVAEQPELAQFQFRATNEWIKGTHSRSSKNARISANFLKWKWVG